MKNTRLLEAMSTPRRAILVALKGNGPLTISSLAKRLGVTNEGIRQHLNQLELEGWVARRSDREPGMPGRPPSRYYLTNAGDHLFPKEYDDLAVALIDAAAERLGSEAVRQLLEEVTLQKVRLWEPLLRGKPLAERLEALKGIYMADDPYCVVESDDTGAAQLIEMNCPYLEVARRRPVLCSVTVSVLRRLLGRDVVRTERFQEGHGRCVFKVLAETKAVTPQGETETPLFDFEPEPSAATDILPEP